MNKNTVTIEDVKENMKDVLIRTVQEFDKPCTYVTIRMKNGFTLRESTTCVDPANYSEEIGAKICLERLESKVWYLLGYVLQDKLAAQKEDTFQKRLISEYAELVTRHEKLMDALNSEGFEEKVGEEQSQLMREQASAMAEYANILYKRMELLGIETNLANA